MNFRTAGRLGWIAIEIAGAIFDYFFDVVLNAPANLPAARAAWMQRAARRQLKLLRCRPDVLGPVPKSGLLISNHLGYFDILLICSVAPAVFVSRADVRGWPLFGWLAKLGGTIFIQRERRLQVGAVNREIETALAAGLLVVVFPEGTSSNGETVLPFRASLAGAGFTRRLRNFHRVPALRIGRRRSQNGSLLLGRPHIFSASAKPAWQTAGSRHVAVWKIQLHDRRPQGTGGAVARSRFEIKGGKLKRLTSSPAPSAFCRTGCGNEAAGGARRIRGRAW